MRASRALYTAAELGIADILAAGTMTSEEIGAKAGANGPTVRRLMRALVAHGVFEEPNADILAAHHSMRGTLFDLPNVVADAPALLQASGVKARCEVVGGQFLRRRPAGCGRLPLARDPARLGR